MKRNSRIKPISYLKANAAKVVRGLAEGDGPLIITQNGEATAVIEDIATYERTQETLAMLKVLALGEKQVREGRTVTVETAMRRYRDQVRRTRSDE